MPSCQACAGWTLNWAIFSFDSSGAHRVYFLHKYEYEHTSSQWSRCVTLNCQVTVSPMAIMLMLDVFLIGQIQSQKILGKPMSTTKIGNYLTGAAYLSRPGLILADIHLSTLKHPRAWRWCNRRIRRRHKLWQNAVSTGNCSWLLLWKPFLHFFFIIYVTFSTLEHCYWTSRVNLGVISKEGRFDMHFSDEMSSFQSRKSHFHPLLNYKYTFLKEK